MVLAGDSPTYILGIAVFLLVFLVSLKFARQESSDFVNTEMVNWDAGDMINVSDQRWVKVNSCVGGLS